MLKLTQAAVSTRHAGKKAVEFLSKVGAKIAGFAVWGLDEVRADAAGYGTRAGTTTRAAIRCLRILGDVTASGTTALRAVGVGAASAAMHWVPKESGGRKFAQVLGNVLPGVLAFPLIVAIAAVVGYFIAEYYGWDLSVIGNLLT